MQMLQGEDQSKLLGLDPLGISEKLTGKPAEELAGKAIDPLGLSEKITGSPASEYMKLGGGLSAMSGAMEKNPELAAMAMGPAAAPAAPTMIELMRKKR